MPKLRSRHRKTPDLLAKVVGEHMRKLRKHKGISFDAFVEESGLGRGYISEIERGLAVPSIKTLKAVAKALDVTMADLVLGDSPREKLFRLTADMNVGDVLALLERAEQVPPRSGRPGDG